MRLVVDTNVLVSGLLNLAAPPGRLLLAAADARVDLVAPASVRDEFQRILRTKLRWDPGDVAQAVASLPVQWVDEADYGPLLDELRDTIKDEDDVPLVAVARLLDAPIVSGDKAFHPMKRQVARTLRPKDAMGLAGGDQPGPPSGQD